MKSLTGDLQQFVASMSTHPFSIPCQWWFPEPAEVFSTYARHSWGTSSLPAGAASHPCPLGGGLADSPWLPPPP
eukprot:2265021-Heterocapsa_arctica.AAC.1